MASNGYVQFDPTVIEQARQIDLLSYLQRYEPGNLKRVAGNVYCTREHDSLKISNGKWYWWSRGFGGFSALDYLMKVRELGFVEAVQTLTGDMGDWKPPPPAVKKDEPKVLLLPEKNPNCDKVTEYLFGRGIDYQLIQDCIAEGIIFESRQYHNAVFVGKDESGKPKYAALRSTLGSSFRQDASGSDKRYSFRLLAREPTDKVHNAKEVFDVSETSAKDRQQPQEAKTMRELVSAMIDASPVDFQPMAELEIPAYYDSSQQMIFIKTDLSEEQLFVSMAKEVSAAVFDFKHNESRDASEFKAYCVAYMVSSRYGVDTRGFNFDKLPKEFEGMDTQVFKGELGSMRDAVASREDKEAMFLEYSELLNSLDSGATTKITINNRRLNKADFEQTILIPMADDGLDKYRKEYNKMLLDKATGANSIVQDKYVTVSVCKKNIEEARNYFARVGADLIAHFSRLGSKCTELDNQRYGQAALWSYLGLCGRL